MQCARRWRITSRTESTVSPSGSWLICVALRKAWILCGCESRLRTANSPGARPRSSRLGRRRADRSGMRPMIMHLDAVEAREIGVGDDLRGLAPGERVALLHEKRFLRDLERVPGIVAAQEDRNAALLEAGDLGEDPHLVAEIEVRRRLLEDHHAGLRCESARD